MLQRLHDVVAVLVGVHEAAILGIEVPELGLALASQPIYKDGVLEDFVFVVLHCFQKQQISFC